MIHLGRKKRVVAINSSLLTVTLILWGLFQNCGVHSKSSQSTSSESAAVSATPGRLTADSATSSAATANSSAFDRSGVYPVEMVGDSITWGCGDTDHTVGGLWWHYLGFPEGQVVNEGIAGNSTDQILARIDSIIAHKPSLLFILAGVNDINKRRSLADAQRDYRLILNAFKTRLPSTKVYVQSVLPVDEARIRQNYGLATTNSEILQLNTIIKALAAEQGHTYLNIRTVFEDAGGAMTPSLSSDGLHLTGDGYDRWSQYLKANVPELQPQRNCVSQEPKCEELDYVRRDSCGREIERWHSAPICSVTRCENGDLVRRNGAGQELERWKNAPAPYCP